MQNKIKELTTELSDCHRWVAYILKLKLFKIREGTLCAREHDLIRLDDLPLEVETDDGYVNADQDLASLLRAHHVSGIPLVITFVCSGDNFKGESVSRVCGLFHCPSCLTTWKETGRIRSVCPQDPDYIQGSIVHLSITEATMLVDILYSSEKHASQVFEEMFPLLRKAVDLERKIRVLESIFNAESRHQKPGKLSNREITVFAGGEVGPNGLLYPYGRRNEDGLFNAGGPPIQSHKNVMKFKDEFTDKADAENDFFQAFGVRINQSNKKQRQEFSKMLQRAQVGVQPSYGDGHRNLTHIYQNFFRRKDIGDNEAFRYAGIEETTHSSSELDRQKQLMNKILLINERCRRHSMMDSKAMECNRIYNTKTEDRSRSPTIAYIKDMSDQRLPVRPPTHAFKAHFPPKQSNIAQATTIKLYCPIPTQVMGKIGQPVPTPTPCRTPDATEYTAMSTTSHRATFDTTVQVLSSVQRPGVSPNVPSTKTDQPILNRAVKNRTGKPPPRKRPLLKKMIGKPELEKEKTAKADAPFSAGFYFDVFHKKLASELEDSLAQSLHMSSKEDLNVTYNTTRAIVTQSSMELLEATSPSIASDISTTSSSDKGADGDQSSVGKESSIEEMDSCRAEDEEMSEEDWRRNIASKIGPLRRRISVAVEQLRRPLPVFKLSPMVRKPVEVQETVPQPDTEPPQPDTESESSETTTTTESFAIDPRMKMLQNFIHDRRWSSPTETFSLNFTKNYNFSYFSLPAHVKKNNEVMSEGALKLPKIDFRTEEKPKPKSVAEMYPSKYKFIDKFASNSELFK